MPIRYLQPTAFVRNGKATGIEGLLMLKGALSQTKPRVPTTLPKSTLQCTIMGNDGATALVSPASPMPLSPLPPLPLLRASPPGQFVWRAPFLGPGSARPN